MTCEGAVNSGYRGIKIKTDKSLTFGNKEVIYHSVNMEE